MIGHEISIKHLVRIHMLILHETDGLDAATDHHLLMVYNDLLGGRSYSHETTRTLTVDGHAGYSDW